MTISAERERQLLASVAYRSDSLRAIQFLLTRVRELEKREAVAIPALQRIVGTGTATITRTWHTEVAQRALEKLADIGPLPDYPSLPE